MCGNLKVLKGIFFFLMGLIMIGCTGILVCALNPSLTAMLAERVEEDGNDEIVVLSDGAVDVGELARTAFILEMDAKTLCSEDCKGICPGCGVDLNQGSCTCKKEVDPRLAVLAQLLEKDK